MEPTTGSITSLDGTAIGYRQFGGGPGLVLLHGMMSSGQNHRQLAEALATAFTVYVPDRRGRGLSGPYTETYSVRQEVEDLDALLRLTGAHNVVGVSAAGIIALHAARALPAIHKVAVYEPPLFPDPSEPTAVLTRFDREMARGDVAAALTTAMRGGRMGPPLLNRMPRRLVELLTALMMAQQDKRPGGYVPMRLLAPTLHYDLLLVSAASGPLEDLDALSAEVLLLGGSRSAAYLKAALDNLERVLPRSKRVEFPGLDHGATWNSDLRGRPEPVARELHQFFAG